MTHLNCPTTYIRKCTEYDMRECILTSNAENTPCATIHSRIHTEYKQNTSRIHLHCTYSMCLHANSLETSRLRAKTLGMRVRDSLSLGRALGRFALRLCWCRCGRLRRCWRRRRRLTTSLHPRPHRPHRLLLRHLRRNARLQSHPEGFPTGEHTHLRIG